MVMENFGKNLLPDREFSYKPGEQATYSKVGGMPCERP